ncbi:hypothetical protein [uncultured Kiloniella sp.]|uniref:hypothetical protein n=1 Tax=uncultured Kiloniella sp. TaxID=1133091 RepID=UPI002619F9E2|nr:hypothetical protein [uncultured Kiloniella sp.]
MTKFKLNITDDEMHTILDALLPLYENVDPIDYEDDVGPAIEEANIEITNWIPVRELMHFLNYKAGFIRDENEMLSEKYIFSGDPDNRIFGRQLLKPEIQN